MGAHHAHGHHHGHGHHHDGAQAGQGRAFAIAITLNAGFVLAEAAFGLAANSMALLADAGHNLSDVLGLAVAWGAVRLARRRPTARFTYGLRASSILAALFNGVLLLVACGALLVEAAQRLFAPTPSAGGTVAIVALIGVVVNLGTALLFARGAKSDLNVRGAFLHMAADAAVSIGVAIAGVLTLRTGLAWIDPVTSLLVVTLILVATWGLLRDAVLLALHAVPPGIEPDAVEASLRDLPGVTDVHHLHIWPISTTETALTAHLIAADDAPADLVARGARSAAALGIGHSTFQIERDRSGHADGDAAMCQDH